MLIKSLTQSLNRIISSEIFAILYKILILSLLIFLLIWIGLKTVFHIYIFSQMQHLFGFMPGILSSTLGWISFIALSSYFFGLTHLIYIVLAPIIIFIGSLFSNEIIELVEKEYLPNYTMGTPLTLQQEFKFSLRMFFLTLFGNLLSLIFYIFMPGLHLIIFYTVNAYIFATNYFSINALRHTDKQTAKLMFNSHFPSIFAAGIIMAFISYVPFICLFIPIVGPVFMAYMYKNIVITRHLK